MRDDLGAPAWPPDPALAPWAAVAAVATGQLRGPLEAALLAHKRGRRVTLRVRGADGVHVVKAVSRDDWPQLVAAVRLAEAVGPSGPRAPVPVVVSDEHRVVVLTYVEGTPLSELDADGRAPALRALPTALAAVDRLPPTGLGAWDSGQVLRKVVRAATDADADVRAPTADLAARLEARLAAWAGRGKACHGDVSLRNLLWAGDDGLGLIDWDRAALAPPEIDLAGLVGLLPRETDRLVERYEQAGGEPVDAPLLATLVAANRLVRALRRVARGSDPVSDLADVLDSIGRDLARADRP